MKEQATVVVHHADEGEPSLKNYDVEANMGERIEDEKMQNANGADKGPGSEVAGTNSVTVGKNQDADLRNDNSAGHDKPETTTTEVHALGERDPSTKNNSGDGYLGERIVNERVHSEDDTGGEAASRTPGKNPFTVEDIFS